MLGSIELQNITSHLLQLASSISEIWTPSFTPECEYILVRKFWNRRVALCKILLPTKVLQNPRFQKPTETGRFSRKPTKPTTCGFENRPVFEIRIQKNQKNQKNSKKNREKFPKNRNSKMFCETSFQKIDRLHSLKNR